MVREAVIPKWRTEVKRIRDTNAGISAAQVKIMIEARIRRGLLAGPAPSDRTIRRIMAEPALETPVRGVDAVPPGGYGYFYWPESCENGFLDWNVASYGLELLGHMRRRAMREAESPDPGFFPEWERPSIRLVYWFWRVSQAMETRSAPLPTATRENMARSLLGREMLGRQLRVEDLEWMLAFAPWDASEAEKDYVKAIEEWSLDDPDPVKRSSYAGKDQWSPEVSFPDGDYEDELIIAVHQAAFRMSDRHARMIVDAAKFMEARRAEVGDSDAED